MGTAHLLILLDERWRPCRRLNMPAQLSELASILLGEDARWIVIEQRDGACTNGVPAAHHLAFSRALIRQVRPLGVTLVDHIVRSGQDRFSFRAAGLL